MRTRERVLRAVGMGIGSTTFVMHRAHDSQFVRKFSRFGQQFGELHTRHFGRDRFVRTSLFRDDIWFRIPSIEV